MAWQIRDANGVIQSGFQGSTGPQGTQGFQGSQGSQGTQGPQGNQGSLGTQGNQGVPGIQKQIAQFTRTGTVAVGTGPLRFTLPGAATIIGVTASVGTAPTGSTLIADIKKNGTTIFTTTGNRPTIAIGANATTTSPTPDVTALAQGDYLTMDVIQVGASVAGSDLTVEVLYTTGSQATVVFSRLSTLFVATGQGRFTFPVSATVVSVVASVGTAPTGAAIICDVKKNGTTIFTTTGNRPTIAAVANTSGTAFPDVTLFSSGDYLTVDVLQVGSTISGADLTVQVLYTLTG